MSHGFKEGRHHNELKHVFDYGVRGKRNFINLYNPWEDDLMQKVAERSWKRYRKHQWRGE